MLHNAFEPPLDQVDDVFALVIAPKGADPRMFGHLYCAGCGDRRRMSVEKLEQSIALPGLRDNVRDSVICASARTESARAGGRACAAILVGFLGIPVVSLVLTIRWVKATRGAPAGHGVREWHSMKLAILWFVLSVATMVTLSLFDDEYERAAALGRRAVVCDYVGVALGARAAVISLQRHKRRERK